MPVALVFVALLVLGPCAAQKDPDEILSMEPDPDRGLPLADFLRVVDHVTDRSFEAPKGLHIAIRFSKQEIRRRDILLFTEAMLSKHGLRLELPEEGAATVSPIGEGQARLEPGAAVWVSPRDIASHVAGDGAIFTLLRFKQVSGDDARKALDALLSGECQAVASHHGKALLLQGAPDLVVSSARLLLAKDEAEAAKAANTPKMNCAPSRKACAPEGLTDIESHRSP